MSEERPEWYKKLVEDCKPLVADIKRLEAEEKQLEEDLRILDEYARERICEELIKAREVLIPEWKKGRYACLKPLLQDDPVMERLFGEASCLSDHLAATELRLTMEEEQKRKKKRLEEIFKKANKPKRPRKFTFLKVNYGKEAVKA